MPSLVTNPAVGCNLYILTTNRLAAMEVDSPSNDQQLRRELQQRRLRGALTRAVGQKSSSFFRRRTIAVTRQHTRVMEKDFEHDRVSSWISGDPKLLPDRILCGHQPTQAAETKSDLLPPPHI
jgi:hypothetical protein